ncbi:serine hydrolase [Rudaeicoccus suwonensis]|uniref:Beta-lactamase n=1 Tax=Rudaeicoccus suwonensis TaxID=657409 RepID=A0A561E9W9_9MICO|nr:serine hydrolase [Rudaeicoccus suwonensis]TWE12370.1 beta-lactamase family protein [Rudaeicoccus suwonensis]
MIEPSRRNLLIGGAGVTLAAGFTAIGVRAEARQSTAGGAGRVASTAITTDIPATTITSPTVAATTAAATTTAWGTRLTTAITNYQKSRGGTIACAVYDRTTGGYYGYRDTWVNDTLSTVKMVIMATVLRRCQELRINLSTTQMQLATAMITQSDNDAANALITWAGVANVQRVAGYYGMTSTHVQGGIVAGSSNWWGYSTTTSKDLLSLINGLVWGTTVLTAAHRTYVLTLMSQVIAIERWGVCAPPLPTSNTWATKNGWGPLGSAYVLNSAGHITGNGRNYTAVILTQAPAGFYYGQTTINGVSQLIYDALATPMP